MRTAIIVATFLAVGASVAGVAGLPNPYLGADVLFQITQQAIGASLGTGLEANYTGGGSGNGATAMAGSIAPFLVGTATQQTAPMTRLVKKEGNVCSFNNNGSSPAGGATGQGDTNAAAIVIGLDAVDIFSSVSAGGSPACQGPDDSPSNDNKGFGLVVSGSTGVFSGASPNPAQSWKWALALVYGGFDYSLPGGGPQGAPDCGQTSRLNLVSQWSNLFQQSQAPGTCTNTNPACAATGPTGGALWHAFRRDDDAGVSDVFATILGLSPSTSNSVNNGFGTSPYCNAINWDTAAGTTTCPAKTGPHDQWTGPGGVPDLLSTSNITGTTQRHRRPPPGVWGDQPDPGQNKFTSADVLPTQQQDNDPIRRPCLGNGSTNNVNIAGEEVCNIDGALGLVLPIVDSNFLLALKVPGPLQQFPTNASTTFAANGGRSVSVLNCAPNGTAKHAGECPNGDALNLSVCAVPIDGINGTSQSVSKKATVGPSILFSRPLCSGHYGTSAAQSFSNGALNSFFTSTATAATPTLATACIPNAGAPDGRHYNVQIRDGSITAPGYAAQTISALGTTVDLAAGYFRIHQVETVLGSSSANVGAAAGCQYQDTTDQIACLTQADPCSIGVSAGAGKAIATTSIPNPGTNGTGAWTGTTGPLGAFDSLRTAQVYPTTATVQLLGKAGEYQLSRKIYFSTLVGFANIASTASDPTAADELTLAKFEANPTLFNPILVTGQEFTLGAQFPGTPAGGTDPQFCEDFNEQTICNNTATAPANVNGCTSAAESAAGLPVGVSTVCGDGIRGPYEECDNGSVASPVTGTTANPNGAGAGKGNSNSDTAAGGCTLTCRCVNDFVSGFCN